MSTVKDFLFKYKIIIGVVVFLLLSFGIYMFVSAESDEYENQIEVINPSVTIKDGTAPFDSDNNPGNDSGESNSIVRNFDAITYAIKDTTVDGREIHAGDYMGILEKDIVVTSKEKIEAACELIKQMCDEDSEIVTLIRGEDATDEEFEAIQKFIEENYEVDIDAEDGKQPVYSFIIGVE